MTGRRRLLAGVVVAAALAPAPALATAPLGPEAAPITVTATPSTGLVDGQVVDGHAVGFDEHRDGYGFLVQCRAGATRRGCHVGELDVDPTYGPGTIDQQVQVQAVFRGEDGVEVDCRAAPGTCVLHVLTEAGTGVIDAPLTFDAAAPVDPAPTVTVTPDSDLVDRQVVHIEVDGFATHYWVRVRLCDGPSPFDRCFEGEALSPGLYSDDTGHAEGDVQLRTLVHPGTRYAKASGEAGPPFDCRAIDCFLVVTEEVAGNGDGAAALAFDPNEPLAPEPRLTAAPTTALHDGQVITFDVADLTAGERIVIGQCAPDAPVREICGDEQDLAADANGEAHGSLRVFSRFDHGALLGDPPVDCFATPCELWLWQYDDDDGPDATLALSFADGPTSPATPIAASPAFTG